MKVSIITITYNSSSTIEDTMRSVASQTYPHIEHIIVDGASKDNTLEIVRKFPHVATIISEPDRGIYNAMNKGVVVAKGDVVGILNSDDFFSADNVIEKIVAAFDPETQVVFGDVSFVNPEDTSKVVRYYSAKKWKPYKLRWGFMPPHPSCYIRRECFADGGVYKEDYK